MSCSATSETFPSKDTTSIRDMSSPQPSPSYNRRYFVPGIQCNKRKLLYDGFYLLSHFGDYLTAFPSSKYDIKKVLTAKTVFTLLKITLFRRNSILKGFAYMYFYQMGALQTSFSQMFPFTYFNHPILPTPKT